MQSLVLVHELLLGGYFLSFPGLWVLSQFCFTDTLLSTVLWKGELIRKCIVKLSQYNSVPHCRILLSQHTHIFQKGSGMDSAVLCPEKVWSLKSVQSNGWSEFGYGEDTITRALWCPPIQIQRTLCGVDLVH